jgi:SAM-dependent methyltransferase
MGWSDDALRNRVAWTKGNAEYTDARANIAWTKDEIDWGIWDHPESDIDVLGDVDGLDVVELGCGTAYFSAWLAKRGARPVGVDENVLVTDRLERPQYGLHRVEWATEGVEFHLGHGNWIDLLHTNSFELERLVELYPAEDAAEHPYYSGLSLEWAKRWPAEEIWVARKR